MASPMGHVLEACDHVDTRGGPKFLWLMNITNGI